MMDIIERAIKALESIAQSLLRIADSSTPITGTTTAPVNTPQTTPVIPTVTTPETVVVTTQPEQSTTATVGADGIPWDARIHGSGKTFLKSTDRTGCFKYKKGVDPALIVTVEAELKAANPVVTTTEPVVTTVTPSVFETPTPELQTQPVAAVAPVTIQPVAAVAPVIQEVSKEELDAAMTSPIEVPKLVHINYLMTQIIQRDGVATAQTLLGQYSGGLTALTDLPDNLYKTMYAVFFNQWNFKNPTGQQ